MGKPRRPRSPRPALAPNQPFEGDPQTETALPAGVLGAPEVVLPPEPPVEAEPAPAFAAALEAATEAPAQDAPAETILHVEAAEPAPTAGPDFREPDVRDEAAAEEPVWHEAAPDAPPEPVIGEPALAETPIQETAHRETVDRETGDRETAHDEPAIAEPVTREAAETPVADQPALVEAAEPVAAEPEPVAPQAVARPEPVALPEAAALPEAVASAARFARKAKADFQFVFMPEPPDFSGIYAAIARYMRGESEAAAAHMRALGEARSPADLIRLQVGELQRAADASLTCWSTVAHKAGYGFTYR